MLSFPYLQMPRRRYTPPQPWRTHPPRLLPFSQQPVAHFVVPEPLPAELATNNPDGPVRTEIHFTGPNARTEALLYLSRHARERDTIKVVVSVQLS